MLIRRKYSMNGLQLREDFFNSQLYMKILRDRVIAWDKFALVHSRPLAGFLSLWSEAQASR